MSSQLSAYFCPPCYENYLNYLVWSSPLYCTKTFNDLFFYINLMCSLSEVTPSSCFVKDVIKNQANKSQFPLLKADREERCEACALVWDSSVRDRTGAPQVTSRRCVCCSCDTPVDEAWRDWGDIISQLVHGSVAYIRDWDLQLNRTIMLQMQTHVHFVFNWVK